MKIKCICILLFGILCAGNSVFAQFSKTMYNYNGNGGDVGIYFWYDIVLTYDVVITGKYSMVPVSGTNKGVYCDNIKANAIINNNLSNVNRDIDPISNKISYTAYDTPKGDYYQNNIFLTIDSGYNQKIVSLPIEYNNMSTSVDFVDAVYSKPNSFPVTSLPIPVLDYLSATTLVESNNIGIMNQAKSITSGCTDLREVIIKLCQWIEGNITMDANASQTKSTQVLAKKRMK